MVPSSLKSNFCICILLKRFSIKIQNITLCLHSLVRHSQTFSPAQEFFQEKELFEQVKTFECSWILPNAHLSFHQAMKAGKHILFFNWSKWWKNLSMRRNLYFLFNMHGLKNLHEIYVKVMTIAGCHFLLQVKCSHPGLHTTSTTFQDLFKEIQDLLYQLKPERLTHFFSKQHYYLDLLNRLILKMKNNQWQIASRQKSGLAKSQFLFSSAVVSKIF